MDSPSSSADILNETFFDITVTAVEGEFIFNQKLPLGIFNSPVEAFEFHTNPYLIFRYVTEYEGLTIEQMVFVLSYDIVNEN